MATLNQPYFTSVFLPVLTLAGFLVVAFGSVPNHVRVYFTGDGVRRGWRDWRINIASALLIAGIGVCAWVAAWLRYDDLVAAYPGSSVDNQLDSQDFKTYWMMVVMFFAGLYLFLFVAPRRMAAENSGSAAKPTDGDLTSEYEKAIEASALDRWFRGLDRSMTYTLGILAIPFAPLAMLYAVGRSFSVGVVSPAMVDTFFGWTVGYRTGDWAAKLYLLAFSVFSVGMLGTRHFIDGTPPEANDTWTWYVVAFFSAGLFFWFLIEVVGDACRRRGWTGGWARDVLLELGATPIRVGRATNNALKGNKAGKAASYMVSTAGLLTGDSMDGSVPEFDAHLASPSTSVVVAHARDSDTGKGIEHYVVEPSVAAAALAERGDSDAVAHELISGAQELTGALMGTDGVTDFAKGVYVPAIELDSAERRDFGIVLKHPFPVFAYNTVSYHYMYMLTVYMLFHWVIYYRDVLSGFLAWLAVDVFILAATYRTRRYMFPHIHALVYALWGSFVFVFQDVGGTGGVIPDVNNMFGGAISWNYTHEGLLTSESSVGLAAIYIMFTSAWLFVVWPGLRYVSNRVGAKTGA